MLGNDHFKPFPNIAKLLYHKKNGTVYTVSFFVIIMYLLYLGKFHITACAFSKSFLATKISYCRDCDVGFPALPKFPRSVPDPAHSPK